MGADNDPTHYAWYRASFNANGMGSATLDVQVESEATIFLNGQRVTYTWGKAHVPLNVNSGQNSLALFVGQHGREKAYSYVGQPLDTYGRKGILSAATVTLDGQPPIQVTGWKLKGGIDDPASPALSWAAAPTNNLEVPAFFRTTFTGKAVGAAGPCPIYRLSTKGLSSGSVWLNGHNLGRYPEKIHIDGVYLPECWIKDGQNSLVIFDTVGHVPTDSVHLWCEKEGSREVFQVNE